MLDLLSQNKKGAYFTRAEISTLHMLKRELLFWEEVFARGWQHVVSKRVQQEQRLLEKKADRTRPSHTCTRDEDSIVGSENVPGSARMRAPLEESREAGTDDKESAQESSSTGLSENSGSLCGFPDASNPHRGGGEPLLARLGEFL